MKKTAVNKKFFLMKNTIQNYPWGSRTSLTELFNLGNPHNEPMAELWMGAHANGCSSIELDSGNTMLLSKFIEQAPDENLSQTVFEQFAELPFLFKVLAAETALSIQVHPSKKQAEQGFQRENTLGIPLNAFERNYKDPNHKPELVFAITPYKAMNGFRILDEIVSLLKQVECPAVQTLVNEFAKNKTPLGLSKLFKGILSLSGEERKQSIEKLLTTANQHQELEPYTTVRELSRQYHDDVGLFAPLLLNVITLEPGQAMFLDARTPHAYINGTALEIMANSDNVLRAGLTPKHIDIEELVSCTLFEETRMDTLVLEPIVIDNVLTYPIPVPDFKFSVFIEPSAKVVSTESAEILFTLDEDLELVHENGDALTVQKGQSVFIPACAGVYTLSSKGRVAKAHC